MSFQDLFNDEAHFANSLAVAFERAIKVFEAKPVFDAIDRAPCFTMMVIIVALFTTSNVGY